MNFRSDICFVVPAAWPVLTGADLGYVGGAEVQQCILARALVRRGYKVSMICYDHGQPDGIEVDGITVFKANRPDAGFPVLRFIHPRMTAVWSAMSRANARLYYQRAAGVLTGWTAAFCHGKRRPFVYVTAHDLEFDAEQPLIRYRRDKWIFTIGRRKATALVVQNAYQQEMCRRIVGRESELILNGYAPPSNARADKLGYVLWVSTIRKFKRPELFLELAERLPQIRFRMIGGRDDSGLFDETAAKAKSLPNVEFLGFVPYVNIDRHFDGARLFVNTSDKEGFPNTFLQAWSRGIPTVSFIDPVPALDEGPIPLAASNMEEMAKTVKLLMEDDLLWTETGLHLCNAFRAAHSVEAAVDAYCRLFASFGITAKAHQT